MYDWGKKSQIMINSQHVFISLVLKRNRSHQKNSDFNKMKIIFVNEVFRLNSPMNFLEFNCKFTNYSVVSRNFVSSPLSSIIDADVGFSLSKKIVKLVSWNDNEWRYSNRLVDLSYQMAKEVGNLTWNFFRINTNNLCSTNFNNI